MPEPSGTTAVVPPQTEDGLSPIKEIVAPLVPHADDPRIARDIAEIHRQMDRIDGLRSQPGVYRDYKYRERSALRVIEQRTARALRKLGR